MNCILGSRNHAGSPGCAVPCASSLRSMMRGMEFVDAPFNKWCLPIPMEKCHQYFTIPFLAMVEGLWHPDIFQRHAWPNSSAGRILMAGAMIRHTSGWSGRADPLGSSMRSCIAVAAQQADPWAGRICFCCFSIVAPVCLLLVRPKVNYIEEKSRS